MKKLLLAYSLLLFTLTAKSQNIGIPNYNQQKIDFYLGNVSTPSNTLSSGVGNVNGVTFYGSDMFVAGNANGILWYAGVSFKPYNLAGITPTLLTTGSGTVQVAVDASGNVYSANENGTVTKFIRQLLVFPPSAPRYTNTNKVTVRFSNDLTSGITIGKVNNIECVWVNNYTSSSISVARTIDFPASGTATTVNKAVFVKLITAHPDPNNEGIALDAAGNLWLASNGSTTGYCSKVVSTRVLTIVNGLNATANPDYALVVADRVLHVLTNGYKLGGLTYDDIYTNRMYCNDQPADGSSQSVTRNVLAFNPATATVTTVAGTVTPYLQTNPGNGQAAIIPCALLPTPIASSTTINAGQTAILTASNCVSGAGYEWRESSTVVGSASTFTTPVLSTNKVYTVSCINSAACQSPALTVNVTVNPVTGPFSITPIALQAICVPNTTLTAVNCGGTVSWYEDTNGSGTNNVFLGTGSTFNFALGANLNYYVRATCTIGTATSPLSNYSVIRTGPTVTPQSYIISSGASKTFTASGCPSGTTYLWDSGETTPTITKSLTVPSQYPTTYNVKCVSGSCNSSNGFAYLYVGAILANNDNYTVTAGTPYSSNFTSNDQALSPKIIQIDPYPTHGNLTYDNTGAFTYTATSGYLGTDFFEYYLSNGTGMLSNYARVNLTICPSASTSIGSGDWNTASTWQCGDIPTLIKQVEIQSGHIITISGNVHAKDVKLLGTGKLNYTGTAGKLILNQ